jgi:hypothetical protein
MNPAVQTGVTIPEFLSHLKTHRGLPVPFTQAIFDGMPDFRTADPEKVAQCVQDKLCAICGRRLGEKSYFICGALSKVSRLFTDPPMHKQCAEFAAQMCPFISGKKSEYSHRPVNPNAGKVHEMVATVRPPTMYIPTVWTKKTRLVRTADSVLIQAGSWIGQKVIEARPRRVFDLKT